MDRRILLQNLLEEIRRVFKCIACSNISKLGNIELTRPQIGILMIVARKKDGIAVKDLAQTFGVTSGAITQFIDDLTAKNVVIREEDTKDRRSLKIRLSKSAEEKFNEFKKKYFASISPIFDSLNDGEIKQLAFLLSKIALPVNQRRCEI